jgi:drug/metabolite transporter (DMT)-like permease
MKHRAILAVCIVSLCYPLLNVSVRFMNAGFGPFTQVYLRIGIGLLLTCVFFFKDIQPAKIVTSTRNDWLLLILMGTVGYSIAVAFITLAVLHTKLLNVSVITATTPFFVFLFTILVLRKSFRYSRLFYLLLSAYGVYIITTKSFFSPVGNFSIGDLYALFFAMGISVYILGRKLLSRHLNNSEITVVILFIAFVSAFVIALLFKEPLPVAGFSNPIALFGLLMAGIVILVVTKLQNFGFARLDSVISSQLMLLQIVFAPIFGWSLFHETILPVEFVGAIFVLLGVWMYIRVAKD